MNFSIVTLNWLLLRTPLLLEVYIEATTRQSRAAGVGNPRNSTAQATQRSQEPTSQKSTLASIINAPQLGLGLGLGPGIGIELRSRGSWRDMGEQHRSTESWLALHALLNFLNETDRLQRLPPRIRQKSGR